MQTFLPYEDFTESAEVLDRYRLNKQRMETYEILLILKYIRHDNKPMRPDIVTEQWWKRLLNHRNHPVVTMWDNYSESLINYGIAVCDVWRARGHQDVMKDKISDLHMHNRPLRVPPWLGDQRVHLSHRAALLYKEPNWYKQFGWDETPSLQYFWPGADYVNQNS